MKAMERITLEIRRLPGAEDLPLPRYMSEHASGMDVVAVRKKYGRDLRIWGGLDKRAVAKGQAAIEAELARVRPLIDEGGYIPHLDHSCPPDIPFANYCYYLERLAQECGKKS